MRRWSAALLAVLAMATGPGLAEEPPPAAAPKEAAGSGSTAQSYHLSGLQAVSTSSYSGSSLLRHYLHFRNADGNHYLVYEEVAGAPGLPQLASLRQAIQGGGASCAMELDCRRKAFCTGKCANMYYQISNVAGESEAGRCRLVSHTCIHGAPRQPAAAQ